MRYLSLFSGIEAASVAWKGIGWQPVAFSEIEPFPCAVLKHHYPDVPNLGDITKIDGKQFYGTVDLIVGGSPCQDLSIANIKREGLIGERSGLAREFIRILSEACPKWFIWENVPGAFSSNGGRDFGQILKEMDKCGYGLVWRVLDAQFFGVPQRRRRIFIIGHLGDWRPPAKVLFECGSLQRDIEKSCKPQQENQSNRKGGNGENCGEAQIAGTLLSTLWKGMDLYKASSNLCVCSERIMGTLLSDGYGPLKASSRRGEVEFAILSGNAIEIAPRRLTPLECERLMGFPDGYTNIEWGGKPASDTARYKALGNSMVVNVMRWLGERINSIDRRLKDDRE